MPRRKSKVQKTKEGLVIPSRAKKCLSFDENGNELWEIENVLEQRERDGKIEYLVKWKNWPYRFCTWEPEESFLEDMSIILNFVKELNEGKRPMYKHIIKQENEQAKSSKKAKAKKNTDKKKEPQSKSRSRSRTKALGPKAESQSRSRSRTRSARSKSRPSRPVGKELRHVARSRSISRSRFIRETKTKKGLSQRDTCRKKPDAEVDSPDTKIVIQKLTIPTTANVIQIQGNNNIIVTSSDGHLLDPRNLPEKDQKMTNVFVCREGDIKSELEAEKKLARIKKGAGNPKPRKARARDRGRTKGEKESTEDNDEDDDDDSLSKMGENESDEGSEVKSQRSDFSLPLIENQLEKISDCKIVVEECFSFSKSNLSQPECLQFKVAFYDDENSLKGYDYVSYEEIKQKKWENALLTFYAQELLNEMRQSGKSITPHIKVI